jgi:glycosyltransferase involved in cell wall biosynthesis
VETVCHVITKLELGGAQEVALYAVTHLDRTRFRPALLTGDGGLLTEEARSISDVEVIVLPHLIREISCFHDLLALHRLVRAFRRIRPSIVHTHSSKAGLLGRWAAWCAGVPIIIHTVHGYGITPAQPRWLQRVLIWLERFTGLVTSHWVAVSQADMAKGRAWRLFRDNVSVVRPGIDPQPFSDQIDPASRHHLRAAFGAGPDHELVGTVACLKPQKAPEDFVAVAKQVCMARPQARFVLVGDGELRPRVEGLIRKEGLGDRICLAGWRRDIPAILQALDAFLLTSHWEGLPRVLLEARTSGLPVVATCVGGAAEAVAGMSYARLSRAGDTAGLAENLVQILEARDQLPRATGPRGEALPREFHIGEMVKQYESLYDRLLRARHKAAGSRACAPVTKL